MMAALRTSPPIRKALCFNPFPSSSPSSSSLHRHQPAARGLNLFRFRKGVQFRVRAEASSIRRQDGPGKRQILLVGPIASCMFIPQLKSTSLAAETKKGFQAVTDRTDGYSFLYPFGWEEIIVQGQDKVFKDVIEPLESVSVNMVQTSKQDIRDLGSPKEVAEALIKKVLTPSSQKTKLIEASEHDVEGKAYYTFEFTAQAPNFTRHALAAVTIGNGKFYTLTTGANERRWEKMKDKLHDVISSFKIFAV